ncbi:MAG TPA: acyltransferase, partial [Planctomycetaceae bacterium]|nr:acyltransferase [Planctomycetaceae bacterium]
MNANENETIVWHPRRHISQLDGLRGLAILLVTVYRFAKEIPESALLSPIKAVCGVGERGVDLFFVLSGFLITGVLIESIGQPKAYRNFLARRSLRIFPLYFMALGGLLAISAYSTFYRGVFAQAERNQVYLWSYLTNIKMSWEAEWCFGSLDHFWSLAVEEHYYLFWPLVVLCLPLRRLPRVVALLIAICITSRFAFLIFSENR